MLFKSIKSFELVLDGPDDAVYTSGEIVTGQVVLELNREIKVRSMRVLGRGVAMAHWLENRSVGMNTVYNDYTSKITYFRKRQHLIRGNVAQGLRVTLLARTRARTYRCLSGIAHCQVCTIQKRKKCVLGGRISQFPLSPSCMHRTVDLRCAWVYPGFLRRRSRVRNWSWNLGQQT